MSMAITHLKIEPTDHVLACPFCGGRPDLQNTHTACYTVACSCGAEVTGASFNGNYKSENIPLKRHVQAKESALAAWNRRSPPAMSCGAAHDSGLTCGRPAGTCQRSDQPHLAKAPDGSALGWWDDAPAELLEIDDSEDGGYDDPIHVEWRPGQFTPTAGRPGGGQVAIKATS
jgi:hypothetical protein